MYHVGSGSTAFSLFSELDAGDILEVEFHLLNGREGVEKFRS